MRTKIARPYGYLKIGWFAIINWVDNVNWTPERVSKLTFRALAFHHSLWRRANARNLGFETLYGGQFTFSTHLVVLNYPVRLYHRRSTAVSLETYPLYCIFKEFPKGFLALASFKSLRMLRYWSWRSFGEVLFYSPFLLSMNQKIIIIIIIIIIIS